MPVSTLPNLPNRWPRLLRVCQVRAAARAAGKKLARLRRDAARSHLRQQWAVLQHCSSIDAPKGMLSGPATVAGSAMSRSLRHGKTAKRLRRATGGLRDASGCR